MLARALYKDASWFLFDEPFRELDHYSAQELYELMDNLARSGKMVWIIAHDHPVEMEHSPARKVV
jgi:ABC-type Mn2+/Zn2+ transport system ATPase subunit